ncbi:hypothetical protein [Variovorax ginsengisoli]|uniref:Uncharacterized protein n=1 Tax=Variovorax ginsengisoli TaxID=363844 RepID=A0ABT8SBS2_9BURK|nr:hypothetical protein [Variovorax ginsengisoli]MDN8617020.1 hypothetical protein [Variovorax ginsengisoli]MDO1536190.1 hypothetical protein [Variovorax ginsengisoli]
MAEAQAEKVAGLVDLPRQELNVTLTRQDLDFILAGLIQSAYTIAKLENVPYEELAQYRLWKRLSERRQEGR